MNKTDLYVLIHKVMVKKMPPLLEHGKICTNPYYKPSWQATSSAPFVSTDTRSAAGGGAEKRVSWLKGLEGS